MAPLDNIAWRQYLPPGWGNLFQDLVNDANLVAPHSAVIEAKQKFGRLRVYFDHSSAEVNALIDEAARKSASMCEQCGAAAVLTVTPRGHYRTLCGRHRGRAKPASSPILSSLRLLPDGTAQEVQE